MPKKQQVIEDGTLVVRQSDEYRKSNNIISSKYRSTLVENKLLNISLSKINELKIEEINIDGENVKVYTSTMYSPELMKGLGVDKAHLSTYLKSAYKKMAVRQIGIEDDEGNFGYRNLFIGADYKNGEFKLYYNPLLTKYYKQVEKSYTKLSLATMLSFKSIHSLRLYELLKKECYIKGKTEYEGQYIIYEVPYKLGELKLSLGIINADAPEVRNVLDNTNPPDYEKAAAVAKEQKFCRSNDFKKKCIEPAIEEINALSEAFQVSYTEDAHGQGGKLYGINFTIKEINQNYKAPEVEIIIDNTEDKEINRVEIDEDSVLDEIMETLGVKLKDAKTIAEAYDYNIDLVKEKWSLANKDKVNDKVRWMIAALKNDYQGEPYKKLESSKSEGTKFRNFDERNYDYDELLRQATGDNF